MNDDNLLLFTTVTLGKGYDCIIFQNVNVYCLFTAF